jgi:hypothetical protein
MNDKLQAERERGILPQWAGPRARAIFLIGAALALVFSFAQPAIVRRAILWRQTHLQENAIRMAIAGLQRDDGEADADRWIDKALRTTVTRATEGDAPIVLAPLYLELAEALIARGRDEEGRRAILKSIAHYHRLPRPLEYLDAWNALARLYARTDRARFLPVFELIGSHSVIQLVPIFEWAASQSPPLDRALVDYARLRGDFHNRGAEEVVKSLSSRPLTSPDPDLQIAIDTIYVHALMESGDRRRAGEIAAALQRKFPDRLEPRALAALAGSERNAVRFSQDLERDPRYALFGWDALEAAETEHHRTRQVDRRDGGIVLLRFESAVEMDLNLPQGAGALYLTAAGSEFLGVYPMLWVSIDGGEERPVYIDHSRPEVHRIADRIEPGVHRVRIEYINDYQGEIEGRRYDRHVRLYSIVADLSPGGD